MQSSGNIEYFVASWNSSNADAEAIAEFIALRAREFKKINPHTTYEDNFAVFDEDKDTLFILAKDKRANKIVGGFRIIVSTPDKRLVTKPIECLAEQFLLKDPIQEKLLPHVDISKMTYCELTSGAVDSYYRGQGIFDNILEKALNLFKTGKVKADFIISFSTKDSMSHFVRSLIKADFPAVIRDDISLRIGVSKLIPSVCSANKDFPFLSDLDKERNIGKTPHQLDTGKLPLR